MDERERAAVAERAARAGADLAAERFRTAVSVETKADKNDVVTDTDRAAQRRVLDRIADSYPGEPVVGEESGRAGDLPGSGPAWIVDPIDGTNNYVRGAPVWATAVAAVVDGAPVGEAVVAPALGDVYLGGPEGVTLNGAPATVSDRRDPETFVVALVLHAPTPERFGRQCQAAVERFGRVRRIGSAQVTLSMVAAGHLDAAVGTTPAAVWDTVAGVDLIRRAGGRVTDGEGSPWTPDDDVLVASNGAAHDAVLSVTDRAPGPQG